MSDPPRRNALSADMLDGLIEIFDTLPESVRVVVLRAGDAQSVWCAGFDIGALAPGIDPLSPSGRLRTLFDYVQACPAPVIAMLHGSAWGGGTDLALRCDLRIADETAQLAFTPARIGLPYDADGILTAMWRGGAALALEMFVTGEPIGAERAFTAGLFNRVVAEGELLDTTYAVAARIAANAPLVVRSAKQHVVALSTATEMDEATLEQLARTRAVALTSADYGEGLAAFREKRRPRFTGR